MRVFHLGQIPSLLGVPLLTVMSGFPVFAQPDSPPSTSQIRFVPAQPKLPRQGTPRAQNGTGSRGDCRVPEERQPLARLVGGAPLELTTRDRPSIWLHLPYTQQGDHQAEFSLQQGKKELYRQSVELPEQPGIFAIQLPQALPPLETGQVYRWYFEVLCDSNDEEAVPASLTGLIKRVETTPGLMQDLDQAQTGLEQVAAYGEHHIWYDMLQSLVQLRLSKRNDTSLQRLWSEILSAPTVNLSEIALEPLQGYLRLIGQPRTNP